MEKKESDKKMNKRLMTTMVIPLIFIAISGLGYASWTDSVSKTITATAGSVDIDITDARFITISSPATGALIGFTESLARFSADNVFPSCVMHIEVDVANDGTLPVKMSYTITVTGWDPACVEKSGDFGYVKGGIWHSWADPLTIAPGETVTMYNCFHFNCQSHPEIQGTTATITVTYTGTQP
jgi:hypothetical protein